MVYHLSEGGENWGTWPLTTNADVPINYNGTKLTFFQDVFLPLPWHSSHHFCFHITLNVYKVKVIEVWLAVHIVRWTALALQQKKPRWLQYWGSYFRYWNRTSGKKWKQFLPTCCNKWSRTSRNAWENVLTTRDATSQTLYSGSECSN